MEKAPAPAGVQGDALGVPLREDAEAVLLDFVNPALNQLVS
jgi:hypothetical protein